MAEKITKPTIWHEMEGPYVGGREHYQEKSYGFLPKWEPSTEAEEAVEAEGRDEEQSG